MLPDRELMRLSYMQLLEERDTLQLRLSTAIRINEELRSLTSNVAVSQIHDTRQESKDLVDQSNDRQAKVPEEDLQQLAQKYVSKKANLTKRNESKNLTLVRPVPVLSRKRAVVELSNSFVW